MKARACRFLGLLQQAQGSLLSVVDMFPFDATMELGENAIMSLAGWEALQHFTKAKDIATETREEARASEGVANAYFLNLSLLKATVASAQQNHEAEKEKAALALIQKYSSDCKRILKGALELLKAKESPKSPAEADQLLVWGATITEKLARLSEPGEKPYTDGMLLVDGRRSDYGLVGKESWKLLVRLGLLKLLVVQNEAQALPGRVDSLGKEAEEHFVQALQSSPDAAKSLLAKVKSTGDSKESGAKAELAALQQYVLSLQSVAQAYLRTSQYKRLIADGSDLALSRRLNDVIESELPGSAELCSMLQGFAQYRAGDLPLAAKTFDAYVARAPEGGAPRAVLELAGQFAQIVPDDKYLFEILARFEPAGGKPLEYIGKRVSLLLPCRTKPSLADEARKQIDLLIAKAAASVESVAERLGMTKVILAVNGRAAAVAFLSQAQQKYPDDKTIQRFLADLAYDAAADPSATKGDQVAAQRQALAGYVTLFIGGPTESQDVTRRAAELMKRLQDSQNDPQIDQRIRKQFPAVSDATFNTVASSIRMYLLAQFGPALDRAESIPEAEAQKLGPFFSFLKGSSHVGLATYLARDAKTATEDQAKVLAEQRAQHVRKAMEEFRREPNYLPCQFELANLELQSTGEGADVNDELLARINKLAENEALEHSGSYLLARALKHRFVIRYRDMSVKNSDLVRLLVRQQAAIRTTIRRKPTFIPAYVLLAQTFLTADTQSGVDSRSRDLFTPNFEQVINILRAVPNPDEEVLKLLAQCYGARNAPGDMEKEREHLENLVSGKPTAENFSDLLNLYFGKTGKTDPRLAIFLDEQAPAIDGSVAKNIPAEKLEQLLSMRKSFETLAEYQGFRHQYLAMQHERDEINSTSPATQKKLHALMLEEYTEALRQFDSRNLPVPFRVLNNLAWYLAEDSKPELRARGLELADRARKAVAGPKDDFDAKDTYAWALYKNGKHSEAEKAFGELTKATDNPLVRYHLAQVLYAMKKFDDALSQLRLALESVKEFRPAEEAKKARELETEIREARRKAVGE